MRKRSGRSENPKTLDFEVKGGEDEGNKEGGKEGKGFFACYLLTSLCPRYKGHTYIGFTVNPLRRIRQHNGEISSGARRTKKRRPWEMVLCIYGFPTNVSALQFEWAWQHPTESLAVRQAAATFKSLSGFANKIKLAYTMLSLPAWQSLNITVNYFSTKYTQHGAVCPRLPEHMKVRVCTMDELPCCTKRDESLSEDEDSLDAEVDCDEGINTSETARETYTDATDHISVDYSHSIEETSNEQFGWYNENYSGQLRGPATPDVDGTLSFGFINSQMRTSSIVTSFCLEETAEDADAVGLVKERTIWLERRRGEQFIAEANADEDQQQCSREQQSKIAVAAAKHQSTYCSAVSDEVEVIDLLTPSSICRIRSCSKKRRVPSLCPEIIDLTRSPNFIQL